MKKQQFHWLISTLIFENIQILFKLDAKERIEVNFDWLPVLLLPGSYWLLVVYLHFMNTEWGNLNVYGLISLSLYLPLWILHHGSKGIRQWPINWCSSPMMHKINRFTDCNYWLKRLDTQLIKPTFKIQYKSPNLVKFWELE